MEIEFLYRLRDEIKFQNPAILKVQIQEDARRSLKFFRLFMAGSHYLTRHLEDCMKEIGTLPVGEGFIA
jgi:hypothetical protein